MPLEFRPARRVRRRIPAARAAVPMFRFSDMRLDAYLKTSRLVPRRSEAGELCRDGKVLVNDQPAKAGRTVRVGDSLRVAKPGRELTVRVVALPPRKSVSKAAARELYEVVGERRFDFWGVEIPAEKRRGAASGDPPGTGDED